MNIEYKNLGNKITQSEAISLGDYNKYYLHPNGLIKRREHFSKNQLLSVVYYKEDETEEQIKAMLSPLNVLFGIGTVEEYGQYLIVREDYYIEDKLAKKWNFLHTANHEETICIEEIDIETNLPLYDRTFKFLGQYEDERSSGYCKFHYNADGSMWFCEYDYMHDYDSDEFNLKTIHLLRNKFVLSDNLYNYYLTAKLLPDLD